MRQFLFPTKSRHFALTLIMFAVINKGEVCVLCTVLFPSTVVLLALLNKLPNDLVNIRFIAQLIGASAQLFKVHK